jgi:multicomponent Na+:H+ antiporter subunit E
MTLGAVLLLNILVAMVWHAMQPVAGPGDFILGFVVGFVMLAAIYRPYGRRTWATFTYMVFLVWAIVQSALQVAGLILGPNSRLQQGIVAVPVTGITDFELAILASSITLTPGTLSIDVATDAGSGERVLYVHNLIVDDPDDMRRQIKNDFERRILRFTRDEGKITTPVPEVTAMQETAPAQGVATAKSQPAPGPTAAQGPVQGEVGL